MKPFAYDLDNINSPIILLDHGECRYTKKAWNAELIGGGLVIIVSDKDDLTEDDPSNFDDGLGEKIKIPTVIIPKTQGNKIKEYMNGNPVMSLYVTLRIHFKMEQETNVNFKFFLNSADAKSIQFFSEFENYKNQLGERLNFEPIYKYYTCTWCDYEKGITNTNCVNKGAYCGSTNQGN
jgi:hypothetical protein